MLVIGVKKKLLIGVNFVDIVQICFYSIEHLLLLTNILHGWCLSVQVDVETVVFFCSKGLFNAIYLVRIADVNSIILLDRRRRCEA